VISPKILFAGNSLFPKDYHYHGGLNGKFRASTHPYILIQKSFVFGKNLRGLANLEGFAQKFSGQLY
jgi:hypothetical protein